jgi:hypothetical protein
MGSVGFGLDPFCINCMGLSVIGGFSPRETESKITFKNTPFPAFQRDMCLYMI